MDSAAPQAQLRALLEPLLARDPGGRGWLPALLAAAPHGERLGALREEPGYLDMSLTLGALTGRPCFHYPVSPPAGLSAWCVEHPDALTWPDNASLSPEATVLRRALLHDEPPGARIKAQRRAREIMPTRSAFAQEWWRFEETHDPDCLLRSDELVLVLLAAGNTIAPVSPWFPERSRIHQGLETAHRLAAEDPERRRAFGLLVCAPSPAVLPDAGDGSVRASLNAGTPHLDDATRMELAEGYLGAVAFAEIDALAAALQR